MEKQTKRNQVDSIFTKARNSFALVLIALSFFALCAPAFAGHEPSKNPDIPEVLRPWVGLEESSSMIDVSYQVVRCAPGQSAKVLLSVFNEGGRVNSIGFTLTITDQTSGEIVNQVIPSFSIPFANILTGDCNGTHPQLSFALPTSIDVNNMTIVISYN